MGDVTAALGMLRLDDSAQQHLHVILAAWAPCMVALEAAMVRARVAAEAGPFLPSPANSGALRCLSSGRGRGHSYTKNTS